jgi:non-heme chloroperoxidase
MAIAVSACAGNAQPSSQEALANWRDPSPHKAGFVTVAPEVRLHYLDWGGTGEPLIFLTGIGNTAHSFDELAPMFTDRFRVIAITRRGQGESSRPSRGYDIANLARDILAVLDTLRIGPANFAAHSFGGQELTRLALGAPARVKKLVYMDAAFDYLWSDSAYTIASTKAPLVTAAPGPRPVDCESVDKFIQFSARTFGIRLPEGEIRHTFVRFPDGTCGRQGAIADEYQVMMGEGVERQNYRGIRAPALALAAVRTSLAEEEPWKRTDSVWRAVYDSVVKIYRPVEIAQQQRFVRELAGARVVEIQGAHHWLFVSHKDRVAQEIRAFLLPAR